MIMMIIITAEGESGFVSLFIFCDKSNSDVYRCELRRCHKGPAGENMTSGLFQISWPRISLSTRGYLIHGRAHIHWLLISSYSHWFKQNYILDMFEPQMKCYKIWSHRRPATKLDEILYLMEKSKLKVQIFIESILSILYFEMKKTPKHAKLYIWNIFLQTKWFKGHLP